MGQFTSDYKELVCRDAESAIPFSVTGLQTTSLSNRISWLFDLKGPSLTMDTACSSSLVALHLACQSLRAGESRMAIVGGCNLMISPDMFMFEAGQGFLAPDGKCKTFDQSANGYGRGEGFAVVVVKPLDLAIADGDPIRAIIRGTAANQDGHTKGFTQPSSEAQASLIASVYRSAGLQLDGTGYVEAHVSDLSLWYNFLGTSILTVISGRAPAHRPEILRRPRHCPGPLQQHAPKAGS